MSAMGQEQTSRHVHVMSDIPLKADINWRALCVRFVPLADIEILGAHVRLTPKSRHTHVKTDVR
jgi:hypothetical protein